MLVDDEGYTGPNNVLSDPMIRSAVDVDVVYDIRRAMRIERRVFQDVIKPHAPIFGVLLGDVRPCNIGGPRPHGSVAPKNGCGVNVRGAMIA